MGLFSRNKGHGLTKLEELNTHTRGHGPLRFVEEAPPAGAPLPEEWRALPALSPAERVGVMADRMDHYVGDVLPKTVDFIRRCGRDAELAMWEDGERYLVVYTFTDPEGGMSYYCAGNPYQPTWPGEDEPKRTWPSCMSVYDFNVHAVWDRVPPKLRSFYENVHDGFLYSTGGSLQLYELMDVNEFRSGDFPDFDMSDNDALCDRAKGCYIFYHHTSGSLLTVDLVGKCPGRVDYWSTGGDFKFDIDLWQMLDAQLGDDLDPIDYPLIHHTRQPPTTSEVDTGNDEGGR
ncbi:hypothetical protein [Pauljensenia hongkongensis]|uniref:Uncharacterized protein n=1 Tax=Pauljensenia hongkongensis TaxID=178339 RepID=A0A1D8B2C4_9ACTO|nr:hypothetical protein [Pauljensenia hongkongensis]AOS47277.1 hypothetical protein BH719_04880 [Pauljensenia hongkongensis]EFW10003.1 hypothetical protein HMPREF9005_1026 [Actinomyces sp. oral taxon 178 str. F0338]